jgi:hypothetical protein
LLQLFDRAYGLFYPVDDAWQRSDGRYIDPFRPQIEEQGFADAAEAHADRKKHLACVRTMFEACDVFVFTLGLTEGWISTRDGAVFPLAPGVVRVAANGEDYVFKNFSVAEMVADFRTFLVKLRTVNATVRVILTVSPVPLIATYEERHVLVSNTYSKAALRVVVEEVTRGDLGICYFPSYEIITGAHSRGRFFSDDLRQVTDDGVTRVMSVFAKHFLAAQEAKPMREVMNVAPIPASLSTRDRMRLSTAAAVVCDEEAIDA